MSELQLGLIGIGILVVAGVYGFNWYQERQFRRRVEASFQERPDDILLQPGGVGESSGERIEPHFNPLPAEIPAAEPASDGSAVSDGPASDAPVTPASAEPSRPVEIAPAAPPLREAAPVPSSIDYVCSIEATPAFPPAALNEFVQAASAIGRPVTMLGLAAEGADWKSLAGNTETALTKVRASLQLADRSGPVNRVQLSSLRDIAYRLAEQANGACQCPEIDAAAQAAAEIDRFCAQVDVSIGCNIVPRSSGGLTGTKVRGLLESAGFVLEPSGRFVLRGEDGVALMSAEDIAGVAWSPERLRTAPIAGLTLTMDVPRVPAGGRTFDRMIDLARHIAHALDASVVDDNRVELNEAGLKVIRQQVKSVHAAMEAQGVPAGGQLAARLFS